MLRDVTHTVSDGLLGAATSTGDGLHVKIGASPVVSDKPIVITGGMSAATIKQRLGLSPLAYAAMDSVQFGANRIYCIPVNTVTPGTIGEVKKDAAGSGSLTVSGNPTNRFSVLVKITAQGSLNEASFIVSIDGGNTYSDENTVPMTGIYDLAGTGMTLNFIEASVEEQKPSSFLIGDSYSFETTAPAMTNGEVLAAIDKLKNFSTEHEGVHIVGESTPSLWQAVSEAQLELMNIHKKPLFFVLESPVPEADAQGDLTNWALQMETDRKKVKNYNIQVVAAWGSLVRLDGGTQLVNLAGVVTGLYATASVQISIGKTRAEAGFGIPKTKLIELAPAGMDSVIIEMLDLAGFLTFREYDGLDDFFVYHAKMMGPDGSDYHYAEDVRVLNKIIRETRKEALLILSDDIDLEDVQGELETRAKFMFPPLQRMIDNKEISSAEIIVLEGQEDTILEDETMRIKIRYLSRGYIREIEVDLGRAKPGE